MKFKGDVKTRNNLKGFQSFSKNMEKIMQQANAMAGLEIRNEAVLLLADNGDGERQVRYMPKRTVNVSAPGSPPNSDTGRLQQSIKVERDGMATLVGTNVKYGAYLEFGTKDVAPRPWLSVAVKNVARLLPKIYEMAYDNFVKKIRL